MLKRELGELSQTPGSSSYSVLDDETFDIERQSETFLQLEREDDAHLRDL